MGHPVSGCCGVGESRAGVVLAKVGLASPVSAWAPPGWVRGAAAAGLDSWRRRRVSGFATTPAPQKRRGNCGTGKKVPPCDADRAKIPPSPIRHHRKNVDPAAPEDARMRRRRRSARLSSHRIRRRRVSVFATTPAPQKRRGNCGTGKKFPPCDADRAKIPPSRGVAGASSIGSEYNAERMALDVQRGTHGGRRTARTADGAEHTAHDTQRATRCSQPTAHTADGPRPTGRGPSAEERLALEVGELLQHFVGGGDDAGVGLETTLGDDQVGELLREIDVRHLESAGLQ